jgi:hypothetical protein
VERIPPATRTGAGEAPPARVRPGNKLGTIPKTGNESNSWMEGPWFESEPLGKSLWERAQPSCKHMSVDAPTCAKA